MSGYDPSVVSAALRDPATVMQTLGAVLPGVSYGRTRLQPGLALGALGQVYGNVQQQQALGRQIGALPGQFTVPSFQESSQESFQKVGPPEGMGPMSPLSTTLPSQDRIQALTRTPMSIAQWYNQMSPQAQVAFMRSLGTGGLGGGTGTTTPYGNLTQIFESERTRFQREQASQLRGLFSQTLEQYRQNPSDAQALQTLTQLMPYLGPEERTALAEVKGFRQRGATVEFLQKHGLPESYADLPFVNDIAKFHFEKDEMQKRFGPAIDVLEKRGSLSKDDADMYRGLLAQGIALPTEVIANASNHAAIQALYSGHPEIARAHARGIPIDEKTLQTVLSDPRFSGLTQFLISENNKAVQNDLARKRLDDITGLREESVQGRALDNAERGVRIAEGLLKDVTDPTFVASRNGYNPAVPANARTGGQNDYTPQFWNEFMAPRLRNVQQARTQYDDMWDKYRLRWMPESYAQSAQADFTLRVRAITEDIRSSPEQKQAALDYLWKQIQQRKEFQDPKVVPGGPDLLKRWEQDVKDAREKLRVQPPGPAPQPPQPGLESKRRALQDLPPAQRTGAALGRVLQPIPGMLRRGAEEAARALGEGSEEAAGVLGGMVPPPLSGR